MVLSDERKEALLAYCRIDALEEPEEALIEDLFRAAVGYMEQAGIREPVEGTHRHALYDLCVNALVLDSYDVRGAQSVGTGISENPAFRRMLNQLKLTEPPAVSDSDT